ncbi:hypothetical protein [Gorillibacterium massiliense]|uniref:hypothetical protein n=1 Tax=Gorillibacterium massiliense TaxID=1280390 RepID=UPI0004B965A7|nr:hypothetical protein [Gorillibacterium massiliense]
MKTIELRPDLRTAGGEMSDVMVNGRFAGTFALIYREGDRAVGSVQLEEESLAAEEKEQVVKFLQSYVESFSGAVNADTCDVVVTYSSFDRIVAIDHEEEVQDEDEYTAEMDSDMFELVVVNEKRNRIDYHVYGVHDEWIAEVFLRAEEADVIGSVKWNRFPNDEEIEIVTGLIVSDFDEETVDTFAIQHQFEGETLDTIELTHEDLLDEPTISISTIGSPDEEDFSVVLIRDDGDVLIYEIYQQSAGGLPIGTATIDIQHRRLTGYIDFRQREHADDAEVISSLLLKELDKEKDYDGLNLALMYRNELLEDYIIDNEPYH